MAFADMDKKANGGGGNSSPIVLTREQEERLSKLPHKVREKARRKMIEEAQAKRASASRDSAEKGKEKSNDDAARNGNGGSSASDHSSGGSASKAAAEELGAEGASVPVLPAGSSSVLRAGDHSVHFRLEAPQVPTPVVLTPKPAPPMWWEIADYALRAALFVVAGAAAWALLGSLVLRKVGP